MRDDSLGICRCYQASGYTILLIDMFGKGVSGNSYNSKANFKLKFITCGAYAWLIVFMLISCYSTMIVLP